MREGNEMEMTLMMWIYLILLVVGFIFVALSFMMGGIGDVDSGDAGADLGGHDIGGADHDVGGGDDVRGLSPLSPLVLSLFATYFGAFGFIFGLAVPSWSEVFVALGAICMTVILAVVSYYVLVKTFVKSQASSVHKASETVGMLGEVTTAIPKDGVGVVDYIARGSRCSSSAKAAEPIPRGTTVRVTKVINNVLTVEKVKEVDRNEVEEEAD
jgi:membrane protein implicated in regulation of membrane protease activity